MNKKLGIILGATVLALVAITIGLCFVFLGNPVIKDVPNDLYVERIDGNFYLVTEYNAQYKYKFKLETQVDGEFLTVSVVESQTNCLNLSNQNLSIVAGNDYRFSACFVSSDGNKDGEYSQELQWKPSWALDEVEDVSFNNKTGVLSWREVYLADAYEVRLVSFDGVQKVFPCNTNTVDLSDMPAGVYKVFVVAKSNNSQLTSSESTEAVEICLEKTTEIVSAKRDEFCNINLLCTQNVKEFEIYINGGLKATISSQAVSQGTLFEFSLKTDFLLSRVDFESNIVQVKACELGQVKESALVQIN